MIDGWYVSENAFHKGFMDYVVEVKKADDWHYLKKDLENLPLDSKNVIIKSKSKQCIAFYHPTDGWVNPVTDCQTGIVYRNIIAWKEVDPKVEVTIWKGSGQEDTKHTELFDNFEEAFAFVEEFSQQKKFDSAVEEYFK